MKYSHLQKHKPEIMKNYSFDNLSNKKGTVKLTLGEIVALKGIAIRMRFDDLAEKLRKEEKKLLALKNKINLSRIANERQKFGI